MVVLASGAETIVSASVRPKMNMSKTQATISSVKTNSTRSRHKTNVVCKRPWLEFWNGYVVSTGAQGLADLERGVGNAVTYEVSLLTGTVGGAANQTAATVRRATFFGMIADADFVSGGGVVSEDGFTITVPNGVWWRTDRFAYDLAAGEEYMVQITSDAGVGTPGDQTAAWRPVNLTSHPAGYGDLNVNTANGTATIGGVAGSKYVTATDWTSASAPNQFGATMAPIAILGTGIPGTKVVGVDGDSIICEVAGSTALGLTTNDLGDADAAVCFAKRALNAAGYSFIDVSVSGTSAKDIKDGMPSQNRARLLRYCDAVITDMLHNDRRSGLDFNNANGLGSLYTFHNDWLRSKIKPGGKVIRAGLCPGTNSANLWVDAGGQTFKNDDTTYPGGDQFTLNDKIMRRGAYSGLPYGGPGECDGGFDLFAYTGDPETGKWLVNGSNYYATDDGTHPKPDRHAAAAAALTPLLPTLLGFI